MTIKSFIPTDILKPFIKCYRIIEGEEELLNRVVPGTALAMAFRFRGQISYLHDGKKAALSAATISGLRRSVRLINYAPSSAAFIVLFKETGVSAFFKQPLHELFEESIPLDSFFTQSTLSIVGEQLAEAKSNEARIDIVENFLCNRLISVKPDALIAEAVSKIHSGNGTSRMRDLAKSLYISQDAFEKRFRKIVGATPKQFSSIVRLNTIVRKATSTSYLDRAFENGYYDQPHFNKDFKLFTGLTPTEFFQSASFW